METPAPNPYGPPSTDEPVPSDPPAFPAEPERPGRAPGLAALLSLLVPGLGQQYVGDSRLAARIVFALGIGWVALLGVAVLVDVAILWTVAILSALLWVARLGVAIDAYRRAAPYRDGGYARRPGNRPLAYARFGLLWLVFAAVPNELRARYVLEPYKVPSDSNLPTLQKGDHFVVTKLSARDRSPERGDMIVFVYPLDPGETFIKRLIAFGGESVEIRDGIVSIDGVPLQREAVQTPRSVGPPVQRWVEHTPEGASYTIQSVVRDPARLRDGEEVGAFGPVLVPDGHVFVLGDWRDRSHDSTTFGPVPQQLVVGRARAIWMPFDRIGPIR